VRVRDAEAYVLGPGMEVSSVKDSVTSVTSP
jgi:hypothetical protein